MIVKFMKWLGFHIHTWNKWEQIGDLARCKDNSIVGTIQKRTCTECGADEYRKNWCA